MKFFIMSLALFVSSAVFAKAAGFPEMLKVHETTIKGLNDGEYQLVRIDF